MLFTGRFWTRERTLWLPDFLEYFRSTSFWHGTCTSAIWFISNSYWLFEASYLYVRLSEPSVLPGCQIGYRFLPLVSRFLDTSLYNMPLSLIGSGTHSFTYTFRLKLSVNSFSIFVIAASNCILRVLIKSWTSFIFLLKNIIYFEIFIIFSV